MSKVGKELIKLADYELALRETINIPGVINLSDYKSGISIHSFLLKKLKLKTETFNYSDFLIRDFHPFS